MSYNCVTESRLRFRSRSPNLPLTPAPGTTYMLISELDPARLEIIADGAACAIYWYRTHTGRGPKSFFENLDPPTAKISLWATFTTFAIHGKVPGKASGHPESWYHAKQPEGFTLQLFKFKDDPKIRFYATFLEFKDKEKSKTIVVITHGFYDPKQGTQANKKKPTGKATARAEKLTIERILTLRPPK